MVDELAAACRAGTAHAQIDKTLDFLASYVVEHFREEEAEFARQRLPGAERNRAAHAALLEHFSAWRKRYQADGYSVTLLAELVGELRSWLVKHIATVDMELKSR